MCDHITKKRVYEVGIGYLISRSDLHKFFYGSTINKKIPITNRVPVETRDSFSFRNRTQSFHTKL